MNTYTRSKNAKAFAREWSGTNYKEKGNVGKFWIELLEQVFNLENASRSIKREVSVPNMNNHTDFIDVYIPSTKVLIEQKAPSIDLDKQEPRPSFTSFNGKVTPYEQAKTYNDHLPWAKTARWLITCNFHEFRIYDTNESGTYPKPTIILLSDLWRYYYQLDFLTDPTRQNIKKETKVSFKACNIINDIYHQLLHQYNNPDDPKVLRDINKVCVRIVFCLYADDSCIFGQYGMFHEYMKNVPADLWRIILKQLFTVLDQEDNQRDSQLNSKLAKFPYVNGGMFANSGTLPRFTKDTKKLIMDAGEKFDWSQISPTIFGTLFEITLNPKKRHINGMHYTSVQNIHKVIDPLFLNNLRNELNVIKTKYRSTNEIHKHAKAFQNKLASLTFFDPACGSGNFLTETYLCLRKLENEAIKLYLGNNGQFNTVLFGSKQLIKVSIHNFYGIEINDFAVSVAKTAMWIAESQMAQATQDIIQQHIDFLPLTSNSNIMEANALEMDWTHLVNPKKLNFIISNPPFAGDTRNKQQKHDMKQIMKGFKNIGRLDYVSCWYKKSSDMMKKNHDIQTTLVSTNSIVQGVQISTLWKPLINKNININFAYQSFNWQNSDEKGAQVTCVIINISYVNNRFKVLFNKNGVPYKGRNISPYLHLLPTNIIVSRCNKPLCNTPKILQGNKPTDGGYLSKYSTSTVKDIINKYPNAKKYFKRITGAKEFLHNKCRWCIWLYNSDSKWINIPPIKQAVQEVKVFRSNSRAKATRNYPYPYLFRQISQPNNNYLLVPVVSSEKRSYIPIGFMNKDIITNNSCLMIPSATKYMFGILSSSIHMIWTRLVSGRLTKRIRYSAKITYNTFPWPTVTDTQKVTISKTAQDILNTRLNHKGESLANLYSPLNMSPDLQKAHRANDKAVLKAYGLKSNVTKNEIVTKLLKMYAYLTKHSKK